MSSSHIFAVGDIQGCFVTLRHLLDHCAFDAQKDRLWLVGDLVNRGPRSLEVLRFVKSLGPAAVAVLGNHDLYLLMVAEGFGRRSSDDTLDEIFAAPDCDELLDWLRHRPMLHVEGDHVLVHAGLLPEWTVDQARVLAAEVEVWLRADKKQYRAFLEHLWGSEPASWRDDLADWPRYRVIVNAMTRLRFCTLGGEMDFKQKGPIDSAPAGLVPWFDLPNRKSTDHTLVTGHWSTLGLRLMPNLLALDSGCLWGGPLSAVRLGDRRLFQVPCAPDEMQAPALPKDPARR